MQKQGPKKCLQILLITGKIMYYDLVEYNQIFKKKNRS